ncbi:hypothetical protein KSS87_013123 [Heliosperma pusillum]|nr:hypothetical protein KSS87_013123 [Heliosperma pusillum]
MVTNYPFELEIFLLLMEGIIIVVYKSSWTGEVMEFALKLREGGSRVWFNRGVVKSKRSLWRLKTFTDVFWSIINFVVVFFTTMFSMEKSDAYKKSSGSSKKWDSGGPGGGRGPYGGGPPGPPRGGLDNVRGLRDVRGADHSKCLFSSKIDLSQRTVEHSVCALTVLSFPKFQIHFQHVVPAVVADHPLRTPGSIKVSCPMSYCAYLKRLGY